MLADLFVDMCKCACVSFPQVLCSQIKRGDLPNIFGCQQHDIFNFNMHSLWGFSCRRSLFTCTPTLADCIPMLTMVPYLNQTYSINYVTFSLYKVTKYGVVSKIWCVSQLLRLTLDSNSVQHCNIYISD